MSAPSDRVIDTIVLQSANAPIQHPPRERRLFRRRLELLRRVRDGEFRVLVSQKLVDEYRRRIPEPRNDHLRLFLELISAPANCVRFNWRKRWSGADREKARKCRYPVEDDHVLRTAIQPGGSVIITEEERMRRSNACIYRAFGVRIGGL